MVEQWTCNVPDEIFSFLGETKSTKYFCSRKVEQHELP